MYTIKITAEGSSGKGIYIGRPSYYQNPFPTKYSKYSKNIFPLKKSLKMYEKYLEKIKIDRLVEELYKNKKIELNCFCINRTYNDKSELENKKITCHGEILAKKIYDELELYIQNKTNIDMGLQ